MQEQVLLAEPISAIIIKCCYDVPQYVHIPLSPSSPTNVQELGGYSPSHLFHMPEFPVFPGISLSHFRSKSKQGIEPEEFYSIQKLYSLWPILSDSGISLSHIRVPCSAATVTEYYKYVDQ
jgi:hypothetical protein